MTIYHDDGQVVLHHGDVREVLRSLPAESVQVVVTSPPYWSLRDYGVEPSVWDAPDGGPLAAICRRGEHDWGDEATAADAYGSQQRWQHDGVSRAETPQAWVKGAVSQGATCIRCGAWRGALGLEPTPALFVEHMVQVFREVRRVLRKDGTLWLNIGSSYAGGGGAHVQGEKGQLGNRPVTQGDLVSAADSGFRGSRAKDAAGGYKAKDLVPIPWLLGIALQADGWWLRQDIIWHRPNPMPESATDRCTKAHEYLLLLTKNGGQPLVWRAKDTREWSYQPDLTETILGPDGEPQPRWRGFDYYYDADAIREEPTAWPKTEPSLYTEMLAATSKVRWYNAGDHDGPEGRKHVRGSSVAEAREGTNHSGVTHPLGRNKRSVWTIPTAPFAEAHFATFPPALVEPPILAGSRPGDVVLDPFLGSGTTAMVARRLGRRAIGIDLNPEYLAMAVKRIGAQLSMEANAPLVDEYEEHVLSAEQVAALAQIPRGRAVSP
jgi:DNA modification methylase